MCLRGKIYGGNAERGLVAGDKSRFSPLDIEEKGMQRPFKTGKMKRPPEHAAPWHGYGAFVIGLKLI